MNQRDRSKRQSLPRIFAIPIALGVLSAIGLVAALVGDNVWDAIGWLTLGVPLAVMTWCLCRPKPAGR